jgi:hypothetical protein
LIGSEILVPAFGQLRDVAPVLTREACIRFIRCQVSDCEGRHGRCKQPVSTHFPTRLIDVGLGEKTDTVNLVDDIHGTGRYVALSHCWGTGNHILQTTRENYQQRLEGILEQDLPKTFLDAVQITRGLGIQYLWIDSLCVVQDDLVDWESEAAKMANVYSGAWLTISATQASDSNLGCLTQIWTKLRTGAKVHLETFRVCKAKIHNWSRRNPIASPRRPALPVNLPHSSTVLTLQGSGRMIYQQDLHGTR